MNRRAYSQLELKSVDDDKRVLTGIASTPTVDRMGDIVEPKGAEFKLPIPFLWQHDSSQPVGHVTKARVTSAGIEVEVQIARIEEPGRLKDRIDEAWQSIKSGLVRGLSIGFSPIESARIEGSYGNRFLKWSWLELSGVTIPANAEASILAIKSADTATRAALGLTRKGAVVLSTSPGASGTPSAAQRQPQPGASTMKTITEQIKGLEATRAARAARQGEIMQKAVDEGRATDAEEGDEFDEIEAELKAIDADLKRLRIMEQRNADQAKAAAGGSSAEGSGSRGGPTIIMRSQDADEKFKGQNFVRGIIAKAVARLEDCSPLAIAMQRWGKSNPTLVAIIKANEVAGGGSGAGEWGRELVTANNRYTGDFIEFLYSRTVYDQLPLRAIPANVMVKGQDGGATGYWVGESKPIPATTADFMDVSLQPLKVAALAVISNELIRDSSPDAEMLVRDALVQASSQRTDQTFLSAAAAVAGVSPAGILNGLTGIVASGTDSDAMRVDIKAAYAPFIAAKNASGLHLVTNTSLAKSMSLMVNALGQTEFPGLTATGGTLFGDPLATGDNVGAGQLILLKPSDIFRIGDTGVQVSVSRETMIEQSTLPTGATDTPLAATQALTSMFQTESTAIKVVRSINFAKRRASAVSFITGANYA